METGQCATIIDTPGGEFVNSLKNQMVNLAQFLHNCILPIRYVNIHMQYTTYVAILIPMKTDFVLCIEISLEGKAVNLSV